MGVFIKSKSAGVDQHKEGASGVDDTLIALPHPFQKLSQREVWNFIANKFHSLSKNVGYVSTSILTMMAFIAGSASTVSTETQEMPLNLYSIIFSLPTFGKTQANKEYAISPMVAVFSKKDLPNTVIQKYTSSGLIKTVAHSNIGYLLSGKL